MVAITRRGFLKTTGVAGLLTLSGFSSVANQADFIAGGLINDYVARKYWGPFWTTTNPLNILKNNGMNWMSAWLLTTSSSYLSSTPAERWSDLPWRDEYWSSLEYVTQFFKEAKGSGQRLHLLLGLSDEPPYPCHQIIPSEWRKLSDTELADALEEYCFKTAQHFVDEDLDIELYSLGNEIEFGILNTLPNQACVPPNIDVFTNLAYLRINIWPREAILLKRAVQGLKRANPDGRIVLHPNSVGRSIQNQHLKAFLSSMVQGGVAFDYISFTDPQLWSEIVEGSRPYYKSAQFKSLLSYATTLAKRVLVGEFLYPHSPNRMPAPPDPGYSFSPEGQSKWVRDFLTFVSSNEVIAGVLYWYPEYFPGYSMNLNLSEDFTGLFLNETEPAPAMQEFQRFL